MADDVIGQPGLHRGAGTGGNDNMAGAEGLYLLQARLIVSADEGLPPQLPQVLNQVVGERIIVIYDQNHVRIIAQV
jgi:hypothetical protein